MLGLILAALNVGFYEAIGRIPLGVATTVEFVGPLGLAVVGSRRPLDLIWVAMAAVGVAILGGPTSDVDGIGFVLASTAAVLWAVYILVSKRLMDAVGPMTVLTGSLWVSAVALAPFALVTERATSMLRPGVVLTGLVVAVLSAALPYLLELIALRTVGAATFSVLLSLEPAAAALMGFLILGQGLRPLEIVAILFVAIASAGASHKGRPQL